VCREKEPKRREEKVRLVKNRKRRQRGTGDDQARVKANREKCKGTGRAARTIRGQGRRIAHDTPGPTRTGGEEWSSVAALYVVIG